MPPPARSTCGSAPWTPIPTTRWRSRSPPGAMRSASSINSRGIPRPRATGPRARSPATPSRRLTTSRWPASSSTGRSARWKLGLGVGPQRLHRGLCGSRRIGHRTVRDRARTDTPRSPRVQQLRRARLRPLQCRPFRRRRALARAGGRRAPVGDGLGVSAPLRGLRARRPAIGSGAQPRCAPAAVPGADHRASDGRIPLSQPFRDRVADGFESLGVALGE